MNIGIFTDTYLPEVNGVAFFSERLRTEFEKRGHTVFLCAPNQSKKLHVSQNGRIVLLPSIQFYGDKRSRIAYPSRTASKVMKAWKLDIIHSQTPSTIGMMALRVSKKKKIPIIHTYHTLFEEYVYYLKVPSRLTKPFVRAFLKWMLNKHHGITVPSGGIKKIIQIQGVSKVVTVLPAGIDVASTQKIGKIADPKVVLLKFGLTPTTPFIVITSRLDKEKNIEFLLRMFAVVTQTMPDAKFLIIGKGTYRGHLEKKTHELGLDSKVIFTGFLPYEEMFALYRHARAFVFASRTETQGYVGLEAMTLGLPVVALSGIGTNDLLHEDKGGFCIEQDDEKIFADAVLTLMTNKTTRAAKSKQAVARAEEYSLDAMTEKLLRMYSTTIYAHK